VITAAQVHPTRGQVLLKMDESEPMSTIIITDHLNEPSQYGMVLAVGLGVISPSGVVIEPDVAKGDRVIIGKYGGSWVDEAKRINIIAGRDIWLKVG